jgi:hypothetical protein
MATIDSSPRRDRPSGRTPPPAFVAVTLALALACGCAPLRDRDDSGEAMNQARERYVDCVGAEAEKDAANPAGAEDIAVAAHARCWTSWDAYRQTTYRSFTADARTRDERQLANDKADAHLRQFELETRRGVVDRIVERTLTKKR